MNGVVEFINKLQMTSVGAFANQWLSVWCIVYFSIIAGRLLQSVSAVIGVAQSQHSYGFQIVIAILGYLGYKVTVNAASNHGIRTTSREFKAGEAAIAEAAERGKKVGAAEARVVETEAVERQARLSGAFQLPSTGEHMAQQQPPVTQEVTVNTNGAPATVEQEGDVPAKADEHEWTAGDPRAGIL